MPGVQLEMSPPPCFGFGTRSLPQAERVQLGRLLFEAELGRLCYLVVGLQFLSWTFVLDFRHHYLALLPILRCGCAASVWDLVAGRDQECAVFSPCWQLARPRDVRQLRVKRRKKSLKLSMPGTPGTVDSQFFWVAGGYEPEQCAKGRRDRGYKGEHYGPRGRQLGKEVTTLGIVMVRVLCLDKRWQILQNKS